MCDLQGVKKKSRKGYYAFTDPQIHSTVAGEFGIGDCGSEGMEKFFRSHICGPECRELGIHEHRMVAPADSSELGAPLFAHHYAQILFVMMIPVVLNLYHNF